MEYSKESTKYIRWLPARIQQEDADDADADTRERSLLAAIQ